MNKIRIEVKKDLDKIIIFVYQENELVEFYIEDIKKQRLEGNIYLGVVKDVVKGMQSAFIDIGEERNALIHIKDILPKESNVTGNANLDIQNYQIQDLLKTGEKILVQIKRDCDDQKGSRVTKDIKLTGNYIILMHDIKKNTKLVLPKVIEYAKNKGYIFKQIDETTPVKQFTPLN